MGKAKGKGKKGTKEGEIDDDMEVDTSGVIDENASTKGKDKKGKVRAKDEENDEEDDEMSTKKKKGKNDKKKRKEEEEEDEDVLVKGLGEVSLDKSKKDKKQTKGKSKGGGDTSDEDDTKPTKSAKGKKKGSFSMLADEADSDNESSVKPASSSAHKKGGFSLLTVEDEGGSGSEGKGAQDSDDDVKNSSKAANSKGVNKKTVRTDSLDDEDEVKGDRTKEEKSAAGGKKSKKKKKKQDEDDQEDIEKMLAELEMEYSGVKQDDAPAVEPEKKGNEGEDSKKSKKKKRKDKMDVETEEGEGEKGVDVVDGEEIESTVKTAAQKKKEKKEREKQKKLEQKRKQEGTPAADADAPTPSEAPAAARAAVPAPKTPATPAETPVATAAVPTAPAEGGAAEEEGDDKKKKKKGKKEEVIEKKGKAGPGKKAIAAMQETLRKMREEEERLAKEEEERQKKLDEAEQLREEQKRLEIERKEKKKQKEKERRDRLKAEGKLLTPKQKEDRRRAQALLEARLAQGLEMPVTGERKVRPGTRIRPNKKQQQQQQSSQEPDEKEVEQKVEVEIVDTAPVEEEKEETKQEEEEEDNVKDTWDADTTEDEEEADKSEVSKVGTESRSAGRQKSQDDDEDEEEEESSDSGSKSDEESSDEESESEDEHKTDAERRREKALARIQKRREDAEKNKSVDVLRAAVVCVLGHVDTGKTKILDKLRRTNVQDGEAGGITQQIGATNVPIDAIKEQTRIVKGFSDVELRIPGLLIIDTPGHESFSNLRSRGSSLCDIAILVVDIMHGLEPQTLESISLLKNKKTPFIVALNKIDRLYDWETMSRKDVQDIIKSQAANTQLEFEQRTKEVIVQFAEQGLNAALFYDNPDIRSYVSLVPTSAITGEGMGNLLALIVQSCQNMLAKRLMYSDELQATVLEVKAIPGLGTTIDAILINGRLREGDTMVLAGTDGPIVTQIRSLLMPQPMKELRVKNAYVEYKEIQAAQGVKIAGKELEKAIAGLNLLVAQKQDEVEICREEVARELKSALSNIKLQERGVYVQASTLGSLEALLEFLRTSKIPYANIRIGPVVKKDVMKASTMLEHDSQYATILAFDVKVERDAQELADSLGVKIFQADIIYHLFDKFIAYREELRQRKRDEFKHIAVFPCKLKVLPQFVFNSRDPIVMGVMIEAGIVREGTPICVPNREFVELGLVTSIEINHKNVDSARKGQEVCIKIEPIPGESPKMFGRHFDEKDFLVSKITRQSIDACKDYFRDDLLKTDWQLMVELKKMFQIL